VKSKANPAASVEETVVRENGYAPIEDYAALGDGRTLALLARDGSIDWLCLPDVDSPSVFARLLDAERGGAFELSPSAPFLAERRYLGNTNVLETTFRTAGGSVRVLDALTLGGGHFPPTRELVRRVELLDGRVPMRFRLWPRFGYAKKKTRFEMRGQIPVADCGADAIALCSWGAGDVRIEDDAILGEFDPLPGQRVTFALSVTHGQPLVFPDRQSVEDRLDATKEFWEKWSRTSFRYRGRWEDAVLRSALVLKLLVFSPSGAVCAAATTSLPEAVGGERNWDYRFCWIRDTSYSLSAMMELGFNEEAEAFAWWFMHATQLTRPELRVLYELDGGEHLRESLLSLNGYRASRPVRAGNDAVKQLQLDIYGSLLETVRLYAERNGAMDGATVRRFCSLGDFICENWRRADSGIWEVRSSPKQFTHSKAMCWVGLDRALRLADLGIFEPKDRSRWEREKDAIKTFIETECWSESMGCYTRSAGSEEVDASLLLLPIFGYAPRDDERQKGTVEVIRKRLSDGSLVRRYEGDDGVSGSEGYFLACSFWMVQALCIVGRREEAERMMDDLVSLANDVGLYSEELSPSFQMLGNFPQALSHLSLIHAALRLEGAIE
jgi:GH15 family glucan-1,4-alpha-glucosidase